ncbi:MAG: (d)CMP kinase [Erysipelotrichaceae bacterium]
MNIAIDGPSAAGKSTIAKLLATKLNYYYLDTGAMYRVVALKAIRNNIALDDEEKIEVMLSNTKIDFDTHNNIYLDNENVSSQIRENSISMAASTISKVAFVRCNLVTRQQELASKYQNVVMEGRDIGSVVLQDAPVKIFLVASSETRAHRRVLDLEKKGQIVEFDQILEEIKARDYQDTHRENSPLIKCDDAIEIDSSNLSIDEVVNEIMGIVKKKGCE